MPRNASSDVVKDTLDNLIRQFSQELCFYRELIQNAIDAGSPVVEVTVSHQPDTSLAEIQIVDYGEGMDRRVIDTQLTRLFSSSKEDDYTKIGKFGIGFVSVFAVAPEAVVIETGKGGERWRVLFGPDRQFERLVLDEPVEGTRVRVYKKMTAQAFPDFVRRSRDTLIYWCRHASAEIRFNAEPLNEPFDLASPVRVAHEEQGTSVVLALTHETPPFFGFYNQGITLLEGRRDFLPGIAFKARSRYLEHTLTRDNVVADENYAKAMAVVEKTVDAALLPELLARLAEAALEPQPRRWRELVALGMPHLQRAWRGDGAQVPMLRCLGRPPCSFAEARRSAAAVGALDETLGGVPGPRMLYGESASPRLLAELEQRGVVVLEAAPKHRLLAHLEQLGLPALAASDAFAALEPVEDEALPPGGQALAKAVADVLRSSGVPLDGIGWARFDAEPAIAARPYVIQPRSCALTRVEHGAALAEDQRPSRWPLNLFGRRIHAVLNVRHPLVGRLATTWATRPVHATHQLAKLLCLADGLHPDLELRLSRWALSQRENAHV